MGSAFNYITFQPGLVKFSSHSLLTSSLAVIQFGHDALLFINSSEHCSSCVASCIFKFAKVRSFKQINDSIVFELKLAFFSDTTLPPALKHDFDTTMEVGIVSKSRAISETIGYSD
ncbi:hypothetical protein L3X38_004491 [Prunus dulcis]|uniref:Uncharacterized protein n=1 Tax=Prunus dulcis TaxID=3755 RepID=A0AAD4ZP34_PRUDU|nr:hypothetical protein L3X38_004491 [Prunus dulcis]